MKSNLLVILATLVAIMGFISAQDEPAVTSKVTTARILGDIPDGTPPPPEPPKSENTIDPRDILDTTPNAKAGGVNPSATIDVWVTGGDISLTSTEPSSIIKMMAYGFRLAGSEKIIVDGNLLLNNPTVKRRFDVGKEMDQLHHTIAHEIGHVLTNDSHPGDYDYHSDLLWEGGVDPYLQKRLMCSGPQHDHKKPGTCLIKAEWDRIEVWLTVEGNNGRL